MTFILRLVILGTTGRPGIILDKRRLGAITVEDAKIEADRPPWKIGGIEPTGLERVWEICSSCFRCVIQALDVDRAESWPDGEDCQEDEALPI